MPALLLTHEEIDAKAEVFYECLTAKGIPVDPEVGEDLRSGYVRVYEEALDWVEENEGFSANPNRASDYSRVAENHGVELPMTDTGRQVKTDEATILAYSEAVPALGKMVLARKMRVKASMLGNILGHIRGGRIHPTYVMKSDLGRAHCGGDANVMNWDAEFRKMVRDSGKIVIKADYKQLELRVLAKMSGDKVLQEDLRGDPHEAVARHFFGGEVVTPEQREVGKMVNFATFYGMGATTLAGRLGISVREAASFLEGYFVRYKAARAFLDTKIGFGKLEGYVESYHGRRSFYAGDPKNRRAAANFYSNQPIQNCLGDDQVVYTTHRVVEIGDLYRGGQFPGEKVWDGVSAKDFVVHDAGFKEAWRVKFSSGAEVVCSEIHPFLEYDESREAPAWTWAGRLLPGALVLRNNQAPPLGSSPRVRRSVRNHCEILGTMIGDGSLNPHPRDEGAEVCFNEFEQDAWSRFQSLLTAEGYVFTAYRKEVSGRSPLYMVRVWAEDFRRFCREVGLVPGTSRSKVTPRYVRDRGPRAWAAYLRGYQSADGRGVRGVVRVTSVSRDLAEGAFHLYNALGLRPTLRQRKDGAWYVEPKDRVTLGRRVGWNAARKRVAQTQGGVPIPRGLAKRVANRVLEEASIGSFTRSERSHLFMMRGRGSATLQSLRKFVLGVGLEEEFPEVGYAFDEVVSIERLGYQIPMKDIEVVEGDPSYLASGLVVHNTGGELARVGFCKAFEDPRCGDLEFELLTTVHDELMGMVPEGTDLAQVRQFLEDTLVGGNDPEFGLKIEVLAGPNWGEMEVI